MRKNIQENLDNEIFQKKVLAFAAHPDDLEFYAGGALAKLAESNRVYAVIVTGGEKGSSDTRNSEYAVRQLRREEQKRAAKVLGLRKVEFLNHKDGSLVNSSKLRNKMNRIILKYTPEVLFTFDPWNINQIHPDHRAVGFSVLDSIIKVNIEGRSKIYNRGVKTIYLYDTLKPNIFVDITSYWDKKIRANKAHRSQFREFKRGWDEKERVTIKVSRLYGKMIKTTYAEAFRKIDLDASTRYIHDALDSVKDL